MKRLILALMMGLTILALTGCGSGSDSPPTVVTDILSDPLVDGDIAFDPILGFAVTQGMTPPVQSVLAGIDPVTGEEFRAFLNFPLTGPGGVPGTAVIVSAVLDIFINSIDSVSGTIPIRIDLVDFPTQILSTLLFDQPALLSVTVSPPFLQTDVGRQSVDVTPLMQEAQRLGLLDFQIRIQEVAGGLPGLIEINDATNLTRPDVAPLLQVTYF